MLEPRSQKSEPWKLENASWNAYPGPWGTKRPAAAGLARAGPGLNILIEIDVRRQGVAGLVNA